jgi:DNA polymerase III epsilon subunit-like protein
MNPKFEQNEKNMISICFDLETTGVDTRTCEIVELAAVAFNYDARTRGGPRIVSEFSSLVKPVFNDPGAVAIHKISDAMLKREDGIDVVGQRFLEWLDTLPSGKRVWIGHNIRRFDVPILRRVLGFDRRLRGSIFDTLEVAKKVYPHCKSKKLTSLYMYINPSARTSGAHRALYDVKMNIELAIDELKRLNA